MKEARQNIMQITFKGSLYYFSIVEKQNDSGIMFNQRIFFLEHQHCIGYLSQVKIEQPSQINFQKAKHIVPLQLLKSFVINDRELHIKLIQVQENRKLEKDWILRMSNPLLVKKWYDKLLKKPVHESVKKPITESPRKPPSESPKKPIQKTQSKVQPSPQIKKQELTQPSKKQELVQPLKKQESPTAKKQELPQPLKRQQPLPLKISPPKKPLQITRNQSFTYKLQPKPTIQKMEIAVGTPKNSEKNLNKNDKQTKQIGTAMSQKAQSIAPAKSKKSQPISQKKSIKQPIQQKQEKQIKQPPLKSQKSQKKSKNQIQKTQKIQDKPIQKKQHQPQVKDPPAQNKIQKSQKNVIVQSKPKPKTQKGKIIENQRNEQNMSKQPINDGLTDRSIAQPQKNKSIRSEPTNRKIQPFKFNRKEKFEPKDQIIPPPSKKSSLPQQKQSINSSKKSNIEKQPINQQIKQKTQKASDKDKTQKEQKIKTQPHPKPEPQKKQHSQQKQLIKQDSKNDSMYKDSQQQSVLKATGIKKIKQVSKDEIKKQDALNRFIKKQTPPQNVNQNGDKNLGLSNKRYISQQQFIKLNTSTPISNKPIDPKNSQSKSQLSNNNDQVNKSSKLPQALQTHKSIMMSNIKNSIIEVNQQSNQSQQLHKIIQEQYSSIKIKQDEDQPIKQAQTWTYKYLLHDDKMFKQFQIFCLDLLQELIEDIRFPPHNQTYKHMFIRNNIHHYHIQDVQVKIASITIQQVQRQSQRRAQQKVCNKSSVKILQNQFNNFHLLYQHFQSDSKLKVPLVCLCQINGFIGLFKILSKKIQKQIRMRQIEQQITNLKSKTKINNNFYHNHNKNIIQLDENYYNSIGQSIHKSKFNCYFLQEIDQYLLQDSAIDQQKNQNLTLLRKELIQKYANQAGNQQNVIKNKHISKLYDRVDKDSERISKNIFKAIPQIVSQIDCLNICFYSSLQLSSYLHSKGINIRYLGHIYGIVSTPFQKRIIMSQMAARSCKALFRKTLQDIILEDQSISSQLIKITSCDFLNCVTSNSFETAAMWKVLSTHSVKYFGIGLNFEEIHKGYFLISLVYNCRLDVTWQKIHPQDVFKENLLFTDKNMLGLKPKSKIYQPFHNQYYRKCLRILQQPHSQQGLSSLINIINIYGEIPFTGLTNQIKSYLSLFISPYRIKEQQIKNIQLYSNYDKIGPSKVYFDLLLMQVKWYLKYKDKQNYIKKCDQFIRIATKYFGEFHPILSELYDIFSSFHLNNLQYEDSITFAKSSLVNILKICGTAHQKTSQSYYNLALCFIKAGKKDQAFLHMKKAKQIFENNGKSDSIPYAIISLKLALIYLNQDMTDQCMKSTLISLEILQKQQSNLYEDELVDCYEMIARCYQTTQQKAKIKEIADKCQQKIKQIHSPHNLQRILKIIIYPYLSEISPQNAAVYIDIINQLSLQKTDQHYKTSFQNLMIRIKEEGLMNSLRDYIQNISQIDSYIRQANLLSGWQSFRQVYPRQTINDFIGLTEELIIFLGEGFISGSLRQAL